MTSKRVRNLFSKFGRTKSQSTTDLSEWSKTDEKLMKAVEATDIKKVSSILSRKSMVPTKLGPRGHSIFHVACAIGNMQIVEMLLKETDDVNDCTIQGNTCLQLAAAKGHAQIAQCLIQSAAEVDMRDSNEMTALHHACAGLHHGCVQVLLQGGADPHSTDKSGKTPLFYAAHRGDVNICKLLIDKGADVNAGDKIQMTPLVIAAREGNRDVCEFLLKRGANANHTDREGRTALQHALKAGHTELKEVFASAPAQASWNLNNTVEAVSTTHQEPVPLRSYSSPQEDIVTRFTHNDSPAPQGTADKVQPLAGSDTEKANHSDSMTLQHDKGSVSIPAEQLALLTKETKIYKELKAEHEQLSEEYHTLSIENLRLRDRVEYLQHQSNVKNEQEIKLLPQEVQDEIKNLKNLLDEEKERRQELEGKLLAKHTDEVEGKLLVRQADEAEATVKESHDTDSWQESDEELYESSDKKTKSGNNVEDKQMVALLRSQILALRQENDQLKEKLQPREAADDQKVARVVSNEELVRTNMTLKTELQSLQRTITALEEEKSALQNKVDMLEEEKASIPSDKVAVMRSHKLMEEVKFDEEGFVDGQDLTKEEFLQAQNEHLKDHCSVLTEELVKLRGTFDAILKAGDNLQVDYDQLQAEKEKIHDRLEAVIREKEEVVKENEFLLSDGNALHEDLKKLIQELEKMQDKYNKVCAEKEELERQATAITIASKVGEVARLLEEREKMQQRLRDAEKTLEKLTHDQAILLEEVQSLQERNAAASQEIEALQAELEEAENMAAQHEALTKDYNQLEIDFNELLKDKERLEQDLLNQAGSTSPTPKHRLPSHTVETELWLEERDLLVAERDQLELTIKELATENALLEKKLELAQRKILESESGGVEKAPGSFPRTNQGQSHLERMLEEVTRENGELEEELAHAQDQIADLEARLESSQREEDEGEDIEALRASVTQLELTVAELSRENVQLENDLLNSRNSSKLHEKHWTANGC
ncbi:hypothetical protein C0Q70_20535 [Pomacea canaliculata]|nr:hypothetical protein C0Q70_20535 [Pomacea canaliculata]